MMHADGFVTFGFDGDVATWAAAAHARTSEILSDPVTKAAQMRHANTWFVGVDTLNNGPDGSIVDVPLVGPWQSHVPKLPLHPAQVSVVYNGYPQQDADESDANHRYRISRKAAHVDGLLPVGAARRRYPQELHAYILGLPLNDVATAPTVVWKGSHLIMQAALAKAIGADNPTQVDVTDIYQAARRDVFDRCEMIPLNAKPGESFLLHRFALHGTDVWDADFGPLPAEGRMIAFFRPEVSQQDQWLAADP
ncbi:hypothetical protein [Pseudosulfitobacter sp. SM2401]|uniref:hypothetical protein n=1 Tax=Pseudosulfitobacter sp. SM2401 TaxID=3350098 RepID=UPI0036F22780